MVRIPSVLHSLDGDRARFLEQLRRLGFVELAVGGVDVDEEAVVGDPSEALVLEEGVVEAREAVEDEHAEDGGQGGEEDGQLEGDGDEGGEAEEGLAADEEREVEGISEPLEEEAAREAGESRAQDEPGEDGGLDAHGEVDAVDGEGAVDVPA